MGIIFVRVKPSAPLVSRLMFLTPSELKKSSKNLAADDIAMVDSYNRNVLHASAKYCRVNLKQALKKKQLDVNSVDKFGNTPLMYAARSGDSRRMNLLINAGATVNVSNDRGETPLHFFCNHPRATERQTKEIIQLLGSHGLHVFHRDIMGNTAAHTASLHSNVHAIAYFVATQLDLLEQTRDISNC